MDGATTDNLPRDYVNKRLTRDTAQRQPFLHATSAQVDSVSQHLEPGQVNFFLL